MVRAKIAEAETIQMMLVGGIAERAVVGVVRRFDMNAPARPYQTVKLFHRLDYIGDVFNDVNGTEPVETMCLKGVREPVQIGQNVRPAGRIVVQSNCPWKFIDTAANVKDQDKLMKP